LTAALALTAVSALADGATSRADSIVAAAKVEAAKVEAAKVEAAKVEVRRMAVG
jgi:hypothetical protein